MTIKNAFAFFIFLAGLAACALAEKEAPPAGGVPKDFNLPKKTIVTLKNGLSATLIPYGSVPTVSVSVTVRAGNLNEAPDQVWIADITGDLMKEGTKTRTSVAVAQEAAGMGGSINVGVGNDQTTVSGDVLSEFGPAFVKLLADVVRSPLLPESELARLKNDRLRDLSIYKTQPHQIALEQFLRMIFPDHPYGRAFPTEQMLKGYTIEQARSFYKTNFGAARTHVYIAGRFDEKAMAAAVRQAFEGWEKGPAPLIRIPTPAAKKQFFLIDRPGAAQSTIYLGLPVIHPADKDYIGLLVTDALLGGSFASRITSNIREQKGYTYAPYSQVASRYRAANWVEIADVSTDVTGPALKEIFYEIERLKKEPPSADELKGIQNYVAGTFVLQNSTRRGIIGQLAFLDLHGLKDEYLTTFVKNVHALTAKDIQRIVEEQLRPSAMTLVIAGDKGKIEGQLVEYK